MADIREYVRKSQVFDFNPPPPLPADEPPIGEPPPEVERFDSFMPTPQRATGLPAAVDAEKSILATMLVDPSTHEEIFGSLQPDDFYREDHKKIFTVAKSISDAGNTVDPAGLAGKCAELGLGENFTASKFLRLSLDWPACIDVKYSCDLILRASASRKAIFAVNNALQDLRDGCSVEAAAAALEKAQAALAGATASADHRPPPLKAMAITDEELTGSALTPPCIVQDYLFADVATMAAPGGTGKTTLVLHELAHIALGRPLYGLEVLQQGWCLFVTAEDTREILIARLREIMGAMELTDTERRIVQSCVRPWDVTGDFARLVMARDGNIEPTALADQIVKTYRDEPPAVVVFDPAISFGAGESFVNDNEQGLISAARRIRRSLPCCVRFIAHTGKANARGKTLDQYSSRGGSALSDGARMVAVLQSWQPGDDRKPPAGCIFTPGSSITILARPKLSYAAPQPLIWIRRTGWKFEHFVETPVSEEEQERALLDQVEQLINSQVGMGHKHSKNSLEADAPKGISRATLRKAVDQLIVRGRVLEVPLPPDECQGGRKTYLTTSARFGEVGGK